jgi:hypothetical protein
MVQKAEFVQARVASVFIIRNPCKHWSKSQAQPGGFAAWTPARTRQFQPLTHPNHLGRAFRVLIQSRQ